MSSDAGMSLENVNIKALKGRFIAPNFSTGWVVDVVKSVEKKTSVAGQFAVKYKPETLRGRLRLRFLFLTLLTFFYDNHPV